MTAWVLAIDFGTTNTVASVADAAGVRTLNVDGRPVMPSAVFLERVERSGSPDSWTVGERAVHLARRRLERFEANPKRCVAAGSIFLGERDVPVSDAIAALLSPIVAEAASQFPRIAPAALIVTHPASWAESRLELLRQGARVAAEGRRWPEPATLAEPVAAAQRTLRAPDVPAHARLVVLDFGGGTVDVSVVDRHEATVSVVGRPTGRDDLGGEDFDIRLAEWMCTEIGRPGLFRALVESSDPDRRERAVDLRSHARTLKEELSKRTVVHGQVYRSPPELPETVPVQVNRGQLEQLISGGQGRPPGLAEAIGLVDDAVRQAPPGPPFGGVFLVGGSSRVSRLGVLVTERTGRPPITHGDPTTAVSDGAAEYAWRQLQAPPPPRRVAATPPLKEPPPPPPPRAPAQAPARPRGRRRFVTVLAVLLLLGGGVGAAYASRSSDYTCYDGTVVRDSYNCPSLRTPDAGTTTPATRRPTTPATTDPTELAACGGATESGCAATILADSRKVWPMLDDAGSDCQVYDDYYTADIDRFTTLCTSSGVIYGVVWRDDANSYPAVVPLYEEWIDATAEPFKLLSSSEVLGQWVSGAATADNGDARYLCVYEYEEYPVAMVIEGPDDGSTPDACSDAQFLKPADMADLFG